MYICADVVRTRNAQHSPQRLTTKEQGLYFVGLDLIGEKLIEVNVTSPTCIQELGRLNNTRPELDVIAWIEKKVREFS